MTWSGARVARQRDTTSRSRRAVAIVVLFVAGTACYVGVIAIRHGPAPGGDTLPLTSVTWQVSTGQLRAVAANTSLPDPPGYPLLTSPLVALFRTAVGSPQWCLTGSPPGQVAPPLAPGQVPGSRDRAVPGAAGCSPALPASEGGRGSLPPWYRSQGLLGALAWMVLAGGCLALLRATGAASLARIAGMFAFLAFLPAAGSAVVQLYHPQDVVSLGLAMGGLAQSLRRRWIAAGLLFGVALLTKQFAVLVLLPTAFAAPDGRARRQLLVSAGAVFVAGLAPFFLAAPRATWDNFNGTSGGGAVHGATVLTLLGGNGMVVSAMARDAPVVFALAACVWARYRLGRSLLDPQPLVGLSLLCVGSRLVFESVLFPYYLLATTVIYFMLDLVARRSPHRSLAWAAAAAFFAALHPGNRTVDAIGTLVLAALAVLAGAAELRAGGRRPEPAHSAPVLVPPGREIC